jgi:lipopolysaccharide transport system ATP-binding protein
MSDIAVAVEKVSKRYVLGHQRDSRDALRHRFEEAVRHPISWWRQRRRNLLATREEFWALQDVSFEIPHGQAIAIIGRNGAGKSTLLKILSRITEPTRGRVRIRGRVASLLEVGTGFHQELTGRENIFLNGAILGMRRAEIIRKFDEIVAFAEIERFLDTPVKRYSTGMYVRLAFAVAAHLEPDILIVDEVLAVGDAQFQRKCLGKMGQVATGGRTVLFVSHNMAAVQALCSAAIHLHAGTVKATGNAESIVHAYLSEARAPSDLGTGRSVILGPSLMLEEIEISPELIESGRPVRLRLLLRATVDAIVSDLDVFILSAQGNRIALLDLRSLGFPVRLKASETWQVAVDIASLPLVEGDYSIGLSVHTPDFSEDFPDIAILSLSPRGRRDGYAPYAVNYRGTVELDVIVRDQRTRLPSSAEDQPTLYGAAR